MDIFQEKELDEIMLATGTMTKVDFVLKWNGEKHNELINAEGFDPIYRPDEIYKRMKRLNALK